MRALRQGKVRYLSFGHIISKYSIRIETWICVTPKPTLLITILSAASPITYPSLPSHPHLTAGPSKANQFHPPTLFGLCTYFCYSMEHCIALQLIAANEPLSMSLKRMLEVPRPIPTYSAGELTYQLLQILTENHSYMLPSPKSFQESPPPEMCRRWHILPPSHGKWLTDEEEWQLRPLASGWNNLCGTIWKHIFA